MIVKVTLEEEDFAVIHDVVLEVTGYEYSNEELQTIWDALPEYVQGIAISWGCNDTVFRDNLYEYLEEKMPK